MVIYYDMKKELGRHSGPAPKMDDEVQIDGRHYCVVARRMYEDQNGTRWEILLQEYPWLDELPAQSGPCCEYNYSGTGRMCPTCQTDKMDEDDRNPWMEK